MRKFSKKQYLVAGVAAAAVIGLGTGTAIAYWTNSGSGSGSAGTGTNTSITVNQTSTVSGMYPGSTAQALSGDFTNSNSSAVYVTQVTVAIQTGWSAQADNSKPACTAGDFSLVQPSATDAEVPSGTSVGSWSGGSIALTDNPTANQDNCKNVSVPLVYTSN